MICQINYLPQLSASANNWFAHHSQVIMFCSTLSSSSEKNCLKQELTVSMLGVEGTYLKTKDKSPVFVKSLQIKLKLKNGEN